MDASQTSLRNRLNTPPGAAGPPETPATRHSSPSRDGSGKVHAHLRTSTKESETGSAFLKHDGEGVFKQNMLLISAVAVTMYCVMELMLRLRYVFEPFCWAAVISLTLTPVVGRSEKFIESTLCRAGRATTVVPSPRGEPGYEGLAEGEEGSTSGSFVASCGFGRVVAVLVVTTMVVSSFILLIFLIVISTLRLQDNIDAYEKGTEHLRLKILNVTTEFGHQLPPSVVDRLFENVVSYIGGFVMSMLKSITNALSGLIVASVVTGLYIVFWLCSPLALPKHTEDLIQRYIVMKSFVCLMYGLSNMVLFYILGIDLPEFYGLMSFILNYIPEFGPIIAITIPIPVIILDSRIPNPGHTLLVALCGLSAIKMFWSNVVEVKLIESDDRMTMHPVVTLFSIGIFGLIWGPTGMMLSVPFMGILKAAFVSESVPRRYSTVFQSVIGGGYTEELDNTLTASVSAYDLEYEDAP